MLILQMIAYRSLSDAHPEAIDIIEMPHQLAISPHCDHCCRLSSADNRGTMTILPNYMDVRNFG